ncbi:MAG: hypothetical protein EOP47_00865 [Sphingobacteriaceae bacterium]|nr:MAG: hypothetical protein EOP47_00865 [Sphingobacteriaceae bacterium]
MKTTMNVLVFSTSITATEQISEVKPILKAVRSIKEWNFDLEDCDKILRVVSNDLSPRFIEGLLQNAGYQCLELAD